MIQHVRYPVGQQSFVRIREDGDLYVDKTRFIERILSCAGSYFFLGRPRRFGKSLFLSTLECFFDGKRELFRGLYADTMDWDWAQYPVLYLDLNIERYKKATDLDDVLENLIVQWERKYDVAAITSNLSVRLGNVIRGAYEKTGRQVVILVDEYDKPLVCNLHETEIFEIQRDKLATLYSNFKSSARYIKFVFLTGVSRFAHLSVFSGLNNITDISFDDEFCDICGITEAELRDCFKDGIAALARKHGKTETEILADIKSWYDGYRFSPEGKDIYNPYSLLYLMTKGNFQDYWIQSGQATLLVEQLKRNHSDLESVVNTECSIENLKGLDLDDINPIALLYQTGYLTIKHADTTFGTVTMGLPNNEVVDGFMRFLLPRYVSLKDTESRILLKSLVTDLAAGHADDFMRRLQAFFADVPYEMQMEREVSFQNAFFILVKLLGLYCQVERHTSAGRIDLFIRTDKYVYLIELKYDGSARQALDQIAAKDYALPFTTGSHRIFKIGVNFSSRTRTIQDWIIAPL